MQILALMITPITDLRAVLSGVHALLKKTFALMASGISTKTAKNGKKMKNRTVEVLCYGIAFFKKRCLVKKK